jgi:hypothetical protein
VPDFMTKVNGGPEYEAVMASMQRLRGAVYVKDGAVKPWQLTADGRHVSDIDERSWHVLLMDSNNTVSGCARYTLHPSNVTFGMLGVSHSALALSDQWAVKLREAVEQDLIRTRKEGLAYAEVGGWALKEDLRGTAEALRIALASYALAQLLGDARGVGTVTQRHGSSTILRRLGGRPLHVGDTEFPSYYDPAYECLMEVLHFDSRTPNKRYSAMASDFARELTAAPVYAPAEQPLYSLGKRLLNESALAAREAEGVRR